MRDDAADVEPALQHRRHLVPGLEHLAPVDALDHETLEDDLVPVDRDFAGRDAEHGDAAAMVHHAQHVAERRGVARHLEADVEAFLHAELAHRVVDAVGLHVERAGRAHAAGEVEPVVVDVGDHDVARADEARDRDRHDADRPRAR